ncbi:MAG: hypothetical protein WC809_00230 [Sinimarinibacterium sp.]
MNTSSKTIRTLALVLIAGLSLAQAAQAAPQSFGPRNTVRFERLAETRQPCDHTVVGHRWNGSTKQRETVAICRSDSTRVARVERWVGPRGTVPLR